MNLAQIDLNLLVALEALLRERSVTRAGERVSLSQPAMSNNLKRLRRLFEDELLIRVGATYQLTSLGEELVDPVSDLIKSIEDTLERRQVFDPKKAQRHFSIAASDYATYLLLRPLLDYLKLEAPGVTVHFRGLGRTLDGKGGGASTLLESGLFDLVVLPEPVVHDYPNEFLFEDRWICVAWAKNMLAQDGMSLDDYFSLKHLVYESNATHTEADVIADRLGTRRIVAATESFLLLPFLVQGTELVALMHERLARRLSHAADIRIMPAPFEPPPFREVMAWLPRKSKDPADVWLRGVLRDIASKLSKATEPPAATAGLENGSRSMAEGKTPPLRAIGARAKTPRSRQKTASN